MQDSTDIRRRFDAYRNTPLLWQNELEGMTTLEIPSTSNTSYPENSSAIRIGKLVEEFVQFELEQAKDVTVLKSNHQIIDEQITLGEIDSLLQLDERNIHLEIVYKFYLYDPAKEGELPSWVGPNQKDSLIQKLDKLKTKQMPLLYHPASSELLKELKLNPNEMDQAVCFKAQLFVPYSALNNSFQVVNNDCIQGFYLHKAELGKFSNCQFFIPSKLDWLIEAHNDVAWSSFETFSEEATSALANEKSPLCWMKSPEGELQRFFLVWWN